MMDYLRRVIGRSFGNIKSDVNSGENLDLYITILIAFAIAVLGIVQVAGVQIVMAVMLIVIGLIASSLLANRRATAELRNTSNELKDEFRGFSNHFSATLDLSDNLKKSGIRSLESWPLNIPKTAREVDMVLVRSVAWLALQSTTIEGAIKDTGTNMRICLVHPSGPVISALAAKHDEIEKESGDRILDSILALAAIGERTKRESTKGRLQIRCHKLVPSYAYYRFDQDAYLLLYGLRRGKIDFPILSLGAGGLMSFLQNDFDRLWSEYDTEQVYDSALDPENNRISLAALQIPEEKLNRVFKDFSKTLPNQRVQPTVPS